MQPTAKIAIAQLNVTVGDVGGNLVLIEEACSKAIAEQADLIIFPELVLSGYPPEDLLFRGDFHQLMAEALNTLSEFSKKIDIILGYPEHQQSTCKNAAGFFHKGQLVSTYYKQQLPNYSVFDEHRYFSRGDKPGVTQWQNTKLGLLICEDIWHDAPLSALAKEKVDWVVCLNASPFHQQKMLARIKATQKAAKKLQAPICYVQLVGGQDELLFDGGSFWCDATGEIVWQAPLYNSGLFLINTKIVHKVPIVLQKNRQPFVNEIAQIHHALILGMHDYIVKNNFNKVVLGVSGGIDSAVTLALAVKALGAQNVLAVLMPSPYTEQISIDDAIVLCNNHNVNYRIIPIAPAFNALKQSLCLNDNSRSLAVQNLQARIRGVMLMAIANHEQRLVLTTSNKSELAVGYSTLYGDMAGAFCALKDVYKTGVYELADYINKTRELIPKNIIARLPTAELAPNQKDADSLGEYDELDKILHLYIEQNQSQAQIIKAGFNPSYVSKILKLITLAEYKRHQSPPGIRLTQQAFGRDWRYPITSAYGAQLKNNP